MLSYSDKFKLADIGLSRMSFRLLEDNIYEEKNKYMAPELFKPTNLKEGIPDLSRADIFSLGAAVYELMTGKSKLNIGNHLPSLGSEWLEIKSGAKLPKFGNCNYSNSLKQLVTAMLNSDPVKRPSAFEIIEKHIQSDMQLESIWINDKIKNMENKLSSYKQMLGVRDELNRSF